MAQISKYKIDNEIYDEIFNTFLQTIVNINSKSEAQLFFNQFLTSTEKIMFSKRLAIGLLISQGLTYREIVPILKISSATVGTFSNHYKYNDDYRKIIDKIVRNKNVENKLLNIGAKISTTIAFGGKGSSVWKEIGKSLKNNKSKIINESIH